MEKVGGGPEIILNINPTKPLSFWSHISVVDESGRVTLQKVVDGAAEIRLGTLSPLEKSILNVTCATNNMDELGEGSISYELLYAGSALQSNSVPAENVKSGPFSFFFRFCPRFPFC